jgi:hypothetical protein
MAKKSKSQKVFETNQNLAETRRLETVDRKKLKAMEKGYGEKVGYLYNFKYASATGKIEYPLILLVRRKSGARRFTARGNRRSYIAGIMLSDLSSKYHKEILGEYAGENRGLIPTYDKIQKLGSTYTGNYRCYDFEKVHNLNLIDIDIYLETL